MKYAIILMDGAADEPIADLDNRTILEAAELPAVDWISRNGKLGMVHTVPEGFYPGSDVALMSVLGYAPQEYYTGRAPLEAAAMNLPVTEKDTIFRCNLVTIADGVLEDYSAGHIDSTQAAQLIETLNEKLGSEQVTFYPGVSYRHILVIRDSELEFPTTAPHDIMGQSIEKHLPRGGKAKRINQLMADAAGVLAEHEVNQVRRDLQENPASNIWLWGQGKKPTMKSFQQRFGLSGSVITAVDLVRGLGKLMNLTVEEVEGATGYLDTNYAGKGQRAIDVLKEKDFVFVHIEAPDEAGHNGMIDEKIKACEQVDGHIAAPLLEFLQGQSEPWRIAVLPDHPTPVRLRTHVREPVPFCMAGYEIRSNHQLPYSETNGVQAGNEIERGHEWMEYFLKG